DRTGVRGIRSGRFSGGPSPPEVDRRARGPAPHRFRCSSGGPRLRGLRICGELNGDVEDLILLTADEITPSAFEEDVGTRDAVALPRPVGVLQEAGVHTGVTHDEAHPVEDALLVHDGADDVLGHVDQLQGVDSGSDAQTVEDRRYGFGGWVTGSGSEAPGGSVDLLGSGPNGQNRVGDTEREVLMTVET